MENLLTSYERDITQELLNIGFANSADSFSSIAKQQVLIKCLDINIIESKDFHGNILSNRDPDDEIVILKTEIKGSLGGISYLVFGKKEAKELLSICLPNSNGDIDKRKIMEDAMLLEVDNMLAAAVITQFSNILNAKLYGDVPSIEKKTVSEFEEKLKEDFKNYGIIFPFNTNFILSSKTHLTSNLSPMNPQFIWVFPEEFLNAIKTHISEHKNESLMKK